MLSGFKKLFGWLYGLLKVFDVTTYIDNIKESIQEYIGWLNWIIPFNTIVKIYTTWLACIGAYFVFLTVRPYVKRIITRFINKSS